MFDLPGGHGVEHDLDLLGCGAARAGFGGEATCSGEYPDSRTAPGKPLADDPDSPPDAGDAFIRAELFARVFPGAIPVVFAGIHRLQWIDCQWSGSQRCGCGGWQSHAGGDRRGADCGGFFASASGEAKFEAE